MFESKKQLKEEIDVLRHEINDLKEIIKTQELKRLRQENARYKEMEQFINNVHIKLKSVAYIEQDGFVLVKYQVPEQRVYIKDGKVQKNEEFYSINRLRIMSDDDMKKIQNVINEAKLKEKGEFK